MQCPLFLCTREVALVDMTMFKPYDTSFTEYTFQLSPYLTSFKAIEKLHNTQEAFF